MNIEKPILKRIQKLLTLSKDKGASKAEAERAMEMAQRLMTKYNITMANIENDTPASKIKHEYFFSRAVLNPADTEITAILCRFYKVKILYNGNSGMVVIGTPENIEIAKYVHGYLRNVFFKCWNEFKRSANEISAQAERPEGRDGAKHASQITTSGLGAEYTSEWSKPKKIRFLERGKNPAKTMNWPYQTMNMSWRFISKTLSE